MDQERDPAEPDETTDQEPTADERARQLQQRARARMRQGWPDGIGLDPWRPSEHIDAMIRMGYWL